MFESVRFSSNRRIPWAVNVRTFCASYPRWANRSLIPVAGKGAESQGKTANATTQHAKGLKLADEDAARFARRISQAYAELADAYYLDANIEPHIRVSKDAIRITIPVLMQS